MRHTILTIFLISLAMLSNAAIAQTRPQEQLLSLFDEAEHLYLIDDYQQLYSCIQQYAEIYNEKYRLLGDSTNIYYAYYLKMCGSYYYGWAEDNYYARSAESYYRRSMDIFRRRVNTRDIEGMHKNEFTLHQELAQLFYKNKAYRRALAQLDTIYVYLNSKSDIPSYESIRYEVIAQQAICYARLGDFTTANNRIHEAVNYFKKEKNGIYYETLRKKGKILMLQAEAGDTSDYKMAVNSYSQYVDEQYTAIAKRLDTMDSSQRAQYWLATHQFLYDCFRLGNLAPEMLYNLALFSKGYLLAYESNHKTPQKTWKQVRNELERQDCAIEFVQYFGHNDEKRIGCLVMHSKSKKPLFIDLFSTDSVLTMPLTSTFTIGEALESSKPAVKDTLYNDTRLPRLVWSQQLMDAIGDAQRVFFAADGMLQQLGIEYMMPDTLKTCYRLSSTRNIQRKRKPLKLNSALLCGGITYDKAIRPTETGNDVVAYRFLVPRITHINELPDAKKEIDSIYACRHNPNDTLLSESDATDENFIALANSHYDIIHISTHGYFGGKIGIYNDIKPLRGDESMSKSGLLFSGSSYTLTNKNFDEDLYDGVLSAAELAKLDLSHTELVVLSACETGQGRLTDDGIYGIQRALKQTGVQAMIVSLWRVNDLSCSLLMRYFHEELLRQSKHDIHAAFLTARKRMMDEEHPYFRYDFFTFTPQKAVVKYDTPHHSNPFIIIDAY